MGTTTSTTESTTTSTTTKSTTSTSTSSSTTTVTTSSVSTSSILRSKESPKQAHIKKMFETFEKLHVEWHKRMGDQDDDKEVDVSSQASNTEEAVFDSTSTADYTSLSDLLDGTSIDEMYPE